MFLDKNILYYKNQ